jgi:soluble lytic murein transglycosylase
MSSKNNQSEPNRDACPSLSSGATRFLFPLLLIGSAIAVTPACAQPVPSVATPVISMNDPLAVAIYQWRALGQSESYSFSSYASFLIAHPGFPDETAMRNNAEKMLRPDGESVDQVIAFFRKFPALTATGNLRFAEALAARGYRDEARAAARAAWVGGALTPEDETRLTTNFADAAQPGDHDVRMDRLLWDRSTQNAARQIYLVSPAKRAIFDARLALLTKAPDAASKYAAVYPSAKGDAGFLADLNYWQRSTGQLFAARETLANPRQLMAPPTDPGKWLDTLLVNAKGASNDRQYATAYNIARSVGGRDQPVQPLCGCREICTDPCKGVLLGRTRR